MNEKVRRAGEAVVDALEKLHKGYFIPEMRLTFIARRPGDPEGDMLITLDDVDELAALIERCKVRKEQQ